MSGLHSIFALIVSLATHLHSSTHERAFPIPGVSAFTPLTSIFLDIGEKAVLRHSLEQKQMLSCQVDTVCYDCLWETSPVLWTLGPGHSS